MYTHKLKQDHVKNAIVLEEFKCWPNAESGSSFPLA